MSEFGNAPHVNKKALVAATPASLGTGKLLAKVCLLHCKIGTEWCHCDEDFLLSDKERFEIRPLIFFRYKHNDDSNIFVSLHICGFAV